MKQNEINEKNKLIAEFMGAKPCKKHGDIQCMLTIKNNKKPSIQYWHLLKYHESFDWLMPVVKKIINLENDKATHPDTVLDETNSYGSKAYEISSKIIFIRPEKGIEKLFKDVVNYIKWFNENK